MDPEDIILRDLLRDSGLPQAQKQLLVDQVRANIYGNMQVFPSNPVLYVDRVNALLVKAFFPQSGPLVIPRGSAEGGSGAASPMIIESAEAWKLLHEEFTGFAGEGEPLSDIRGAFVEVLKMVMGSDLPLDPPPRWTAQAMMWIQKITGLLNERLQISLTIPPGN